MATTTLDSKIPAGPIEKKWDEHKGHLKLVNPNNKRKFTVLVVGSGGILVELARDAALKLLPVGAADVRQMSDGLKLKTLLKGFRGKPAADEAALVKAAVGLGRFFLDHRDKLADIEINPLIVRAKGQGAAAVDVRAVWRSQAREA